MPFIQFLAPSKADAVSRLNSARNGSDGTCRATLSYIVWSVRASTSLRPWLRADTHASLTAWSKSTRGPRSPNDVLQPPRGQRRWCMNCPSGKWPVCGFQSRRVNFLPQADLAFRAVIDSQPHTSNEAWQRGERQEAGMTPAESGRLSAGRELFIPATQWAPNRWSCRVAPRLAQASFSFRLPRKPIQNFFTRDVGLSPRFYEGPIMVQ